MEALKSYPHSVVLNDGTQVTLRPLARKDKAKLIDFFSRVPAEDRLYLRDDVTNKDLVAGWVDNLNFDLVLPIIAEVQEQIVGDITLQRRRFGWKKHLGDVRVVVAREFQKKGLGSVLIKDIITLATELGLEKLMVEVPVKSIAAIKAFSRCGFQRISVLNDLVKDQSGQYASISVMVYDLRPPEF
ncbi:MAG: GNAT family N-acetyltransferase [Deltaproteobacteria bacterium]|nr:GNAT family N-acetyltransferase [Deltaproteobacteria bacterium]MBW2070813.1 GNAT family N-acetyltransferase [Deltaproteobacteria bacterium]